MESDRRKKKVIRYCDRQLSTLVRVLFGQQGVEAKVNAVRDAVIEDVAYKDVCMDIKCLFERIVPFLTGSAVYAVKGEKATVRDKLIAEQEVRKIIEVYKENTDTESLRESFDAWDSVAEFAGVRPEFRSNNMYATTLVCHAILSLINDGYRSKLLDSVEVSDILEMIFDKDVIKAKDPMEQIGEELLSK